MLPPVSCEYCGRIFKHKGFYKLHHINSIVSCKTKLIIAEQDKLYLEKHPDVLKEDKKLMKRETTEEQKKYLKQYRLDNKDKIKRQRQEYYQNNKDKFNVKKLGSVGGVR